MIRASIITALFTLTLATSAAAHRADEYLQATRIELTSSTAGFEMRLVPGIAVATTVLNAIDTNHDGELSEIEARNYALQVLDDLSLTLDGHPTPLRLLSHRLDSVDDLRQGLGEIHLTLDADLPDGGASRRMVFENHHEPTISAYIANTLVPDGRDIRITRQSRDFRQVVCTIDYEQTPSGGLIRSFDGPPRWGLLIGSAAVFSGGWIAARRRRAALAGPQRRSAFP